MKKDSHKPVILHIEDDKGIAITIDGILDSYAEIVHAQTVAEAKQCLNDGSFDLVILDLQLPDGSGLDILPIISDEKNIPVLVHSATEVSETMSNVDAVIYKSYLDPKELLRTVKELIEK